MEKYDLTTWPTYLHTYLVTLHVLLVHVLFCCLFIFHIIMISFSHVNNDHKMSEMRFELMLGGFFTF